MPLIRFNVLVEHVRCRALNNFKSNPSQVLGLKCGGRLSICPPLKLVRTLPFLSRKHFFPRGQTT